MELFEKLAPQVPSLVVMAIIVAMFLKSSDTQRKDAHENLASHINNFLGYMKDQREAWIKELREIHSEHMEARRVQHKSLDDQMELARETARGNMEIAQAITQLSNEIRNYPRKIDL